ncbi:MAG: transporter [Methylocella sp.]
MHVGLVGYVYNQLTGDSGSGAVLGDFKSQASAINPQLGYFFKVGDRQWYANRKGSRV